MIVSQRSSAVERRHRIPPEVARAIRAAAIVVKGVQKVVRRGLKIPSALFTQTNGWEEISLPDFGGDSGLRFVRHP